MNTSTGSESDARKKLSDALRLAAKFDLHEGIDNHFSFALSPQRILINPFGIHWSQMTPDALLTIDANGRQIAGSGEVERSAAMIHSAGHTAVPRHRAILHTHMPYATALTMVEGGELENAHQTALRFWRRTHYQSPYRGLAHDLSEGQRLAETSGDADIVFLSNHGVVVAGESIEIAFDDLYYLERAARQQVLALSTNLPLRLIAGEVCDLTAAQFLASQRHNAERHFEALQRLLPAVSSR
jgi:ribulose-5-phosphate 4-epimerase/fuculose-1-phosphate aldolase